MHQFAYIIDIMKVFPFMKSWGGGILGGIISHFIGLQPIKWCLFQISVANRDNNNFSVLKIGYEIQQLSNGKFIEF